MKRRLSPAYRLATIAVLAIAAGDPWWRLRPAAIPGAAAPDAAVVAACAWLAWLLAGYLLLSVVISALSTLGQVLTGSTGPGSGPARGPGHLAGLTSLAPRAVRRWVSAAASAGVAATILTTVAAGPAGAATPRVAVTATANALDWPGLTATSTSLAPALPSRPAASAPRRRTPRSHPPHAQVGLVTGGAVAPREATSGTPEPAVVVHAGDSLWSIAARALPAPASNAQILASWRSWYATNRAVIGPDPDLIRPGQRLVAPPTALMTRHAPRSTS